MKLRISKLRLIIIITNSNTLKITTILISKLLTIAHYLRLIITTTIAIFIFINFILLLNRNLIIIIHITTIIVQIQRTLFNRIILAILLFINTRLRNITIISLMDLQYLQLSLKLS